MATNSTKPSAPSMGALGVVGGASGAGSTSPSPELEPVRDKIVNMLLSELSNIEIEKVEIEDDMVHVRIHPKYSIIANEEIAVITSIAKRLGMTVNYVIYVVNDELYIQTSYLYPVEEGE